MVTYLLENIDNAFVCAGHAGGVKVMYVNLGLRPRLTEMKGAVQ